MASTFNNNFVFFFTIIESLFKHEKRISVCITNAHDRAIQHRKSNKNKFI